MAEDTGQAPFAALRAAVEALRERHGPSATDHPEIDVRWLLAAVRSDSDVRLAERLGREADEAGTAPELAMPRAFHGDAAIEIKHEYSLAELLAYQDALFVRNAYRALLQREPDPEGFESHVRMLREMATSRVELVWHLRRSAEGRAANVRVRGLVAALFVRRTLRMPVIGGLIGTLLYAFRLGMIVRNLEHQDAMAARRDREMRAAIDAVAMAVEGEARRSRAHGAAALRAAADVAERALGARREIERLVELIEQRAPIEEIRRLAETTLDALDSVRVTKAERSEVDGRLAEVRASVESKADAAQAWSAINRKAEALEVDRRVGELGEHVARKVDRTEVAAMLSRDRIEAALRQGDENLDAFYFAFEERFRGSRADIKQRVSVYLPVVTATGAGTAERPVLDIGCGRGEWLETLRDAGLAARGIDLNDIMVQQCRVQGLDVVRGDALEYLRQVEPNSLGAVTAMHVIEHLTLQQLIALLQRTQRALAPGGVAIFETPNPENLLVGACNFWFDPTHIHPMPPEATRFTVASQGFTRVEIMRLHPYPPEMLLKGADNNDDTTRRLNDFLFSAQDYSIVAYKS